MTSLSEWVWIRRFINNSQKFCVQKKEQIAMNVDMTQGSPMKTMLLFAVPMILGNTIYSWIYVPYLKIKISECRINRKCIREIANFSTLTCIQQSIMNLGILMVQGVVNSFGPIIMAAFAAAVKIDAFAYMPVQDFGNAFSTFIAQNYGAGKNERIRAGIRGAVIAVMAFGVIVSAAVWISAPWLMSLFVSADESAIISEGVRYLHIEGAFYCGIGCLFLLYGLYRALGRPGMSVVLTIASLGTRVFLAHVLSRIPMIGVVGIWWAVPIGWGLADIMGFYIFNKNKKKCW